MKDVARDNEMMDEIKKIRSKYVLWFGYKKPGSILLILVSILMLGCNKNQNPTITDEIKYPQEAIKDSIIVRGKITKIAYGYCGIICMGGMIEVKLKEKIKNYEHQYIYIVTACMSNKVKINTKINVIATKLLPTDSACYYHCYLKIDSKGLEYYKLSESESSKIK